MKNNKFSGVYSKLENRHEKILENHPDKYEFMKKLFMQAIEVFDVAYGD